MSRPRGQQLPRVGPQHPPRADPPSDGFGLFLPNWKFRVFRSSALVCSHVRYGSLRGSASQGAAELPTLCAGTQSTVIAALCYSSFLTWNSIRAKVLQLLRPNVDCPAIARGFFYTPTTNLPSLLSSLILSLSKPSPVAHKAVRHGPIACL
jgi:hypothetical protein